jgi:hypothetical protein
MKEVPVAKTEPIQRSRNITPQTTGESPVQLQLKSKEIDTISCKTQAGKNPDKTTKTN